MKKSLLVLISLLALPLTTFAQHDFKMGGVLEAEFTLQERQFIAAGKNPLLQVWVDLIANKMAERDPNVTRETLLDGDHKNFEFLGIKFDTTDVFNPQVDLTIERPDESIHVMNLKPSFTKVNDNLIEMEIDEMREMVDKGSTSAAILNSVRDKKNGFLQVLEDQASGQKKFTPRFESQMGFHSEEAFRKALEESVEITITYEPQGELSVSDGGDFKVSFELESGETITKHLSSLPLEELL